MYIGFVVTLCIVKVVFQHISMYIDAVVPLCAIACFIWTGQSPGSSTS